MRRRRLLLGAGTVLGASGTLGTGAFTSVSADRSVQVSVVDDASAYLRLVPVPSSGNSAYVNTDGGTLSIDMSDSNGGVLGNGVNPNATTVFDDLFRIENQGTQTIYVWILESGGRTGSKRHAFYVGDWPTTNGGGSAQAISVADYNNGLANTRPRELQPQSDAGIDTAAVELGVGEFVDVGLVVDTPEGSAGSAILKDGQTMTINATADREGLADVFTPVYDPPQ
jgi:hypothetical protein